MQSETSSIRTMDGLSSHDIPVLQQRYGKNVFEVTRSRRFIRIVADIASEPMMILLIIACSLYFILGEVSEGIMMLVAMSIVTTISLYQEIKSSRALDALKQLTEPKVTVIRDGRESIIAVEELVPGDTILLSEGMRVPADAIILQENDCSVNESIITGESMPVEKHTGEDKNALYRGTTINSGKCIARVTATGSRTVIGKLGKQVEGYRPLKTLLQSQINRFVRRLALFGMVGFTAIFLINYFNYHNWIASLLFALTLAMSVVPEEIPVAFSSFMALGAYKLSKLGIISRQPAVVENLGAVSVICLDKTGTITENKMQVVSVYDYTTNSMLTPGDAAGLKQTKVLFYAALSSETDPFDSMEKAIWSAYYTYNDPETISPFKMIFEYPLEGNPPMMTHVYESVDRKLVAAKGAIERVLRVCKLNTADNEKIMQHVVSLASKGFRVIGVASAIHEQTEFPASQDNFDWRFEGIIALQDPLKKNIPGVLKHLYRAGIDIKLITGDHTETAVTIASQAGIPAADSFMTGETVMRMSNEALRKRVKSIQVYSRMFPEAKLKVIEALKANGEIVAMTGDGVNDGPALKAANIGIAMGQRGTTIAREASDIVLTDDNLERIVTAVEEGRKIFSNLKKAVRYIVSIHIPIILVASVPAILGWTYQNIFTPIHVIFMELIMGPTCSIFFEKEPVEKSIMSQQPRRRDTGIFSKEEFLISVVQGLVISLGVLILYYYNMRAGIGVEETRSIVFVTLIISNVFLTFTCRSSTENILHTIRYKNNLAPFIVLASAVFLAGLLLVPGIRDMFQLTAMSAGQLLLSLAVAVASVGWFEVYKMNLNRLSLN